MGFVRPPCARGPVFSTPSTPDITCVDDTGTRPPPACDFWVPPRTPGSVARLGAEEICGPRSHRAGNHRSSLRSLQTATDRGLRRYSPPARAPSHASLHPFGPCPHRVIRSLVPLPRSLIRPVVRSCAHPPIPTFAQVAHRSFARSLALSYVARVVRSFARTVLLLGFLSFIARSLALVSVRSLARSLARSFVRSPIRLFAHS